MLALVYRFPAGCSCGTLKLFAVDAFTTPLMQSLNFPCIFREHLVFNTLSTVLGMLILLKHGKLCDVLHNHMLHQGSPTVDDTICASMTRYVDLSICHKT